MAGATLDGAASGPLAPALAVSVALHAAALAGLPDLWTFSEPPAPSPLTAWLEPAGEPAQAEAPAPAAAAAVAPRPRQARTAGATAPRAAPAPLAPPVIQEATPAEAVSVAVSAPEARASPVPASVAAPAASSEAAAETPADPGSVAQYRLALIGVAKEHKTYPPRAIDRGLEGRVDIRLVVSADGAPARVLVQRSSRHDVLDREALELLRKAAALTPVPPALRNREFAVEVPVLYELKDAR